VTTALDILHGFESGVITVGDNETSTVRVFEIDGYKDWASAVGMPAKGDPHPDNPNLLARRFTVVGISKKAAAGLSPDYDRSIVTVEYSSVGPYNNTTTMWKTESGETLEIGGGRVFQISGNPVDVPFNITVLMEEIVVPVRGMLNPPWMAIRACRGKLNSAAWRPALDSDGLMPAGTVMFCGTPKREQRYEDGAPGLLWDIDFMFRYNEMGWNYAWDGAAGVWDLVVPVPYASEWFLQLPV